MGFVKHAFVLSMYCLMRAADKPINKLYDWAISQCVKLQGDTDTNAAIVGGLIGALVTVDNIDQHKLQTLLQCKQDRARGGSHGDSTPNFMMPGRGCVNQILELVAIAPNTLEMATEFVSQGIVL